jgi:putative DNA primase/helicase
MFFEDSGAADAFAANFKENLIWCGDDKWYLREKEIFEPVCFEIVQGLAKEFLQSQVGSINQAPLMLSPLKDCLGRTRINASVELSKATLFLEPVHLMRIRIWLDAEMVVFCDLLQRTPTLTARWSRKS